MLPIPNQLRDLRQVADKLKVVLLPLGQASQDSVLLKLRECTFSDLSNEVEFAYRIFFLYRRGPLVLSLIH
jgi:hypothetical protein